MRSHAPLVITCVDRESLAALRERPGGILHEIVPDIIVFDESFVDHAVPFGAFTARKSLFACWNKPGKATFHSTTFQPNTISTLHFMNCLAKADPDFAGEYREHFQALRTDLSLRAVTFRGYYNPSLYRLIRATGFRTEDVRAAGSFVVVNGRPILDAVSGVACSFRGHNPVTYADEMKTRGVFPRSELGLRGRAPPTASGSHRPRFLLARCQWRDRRRECPEARACRSVSETPHPRPQGGLRRQDLALAHGYWQSVL